MSVQEILQSNNQGERVFIVVNNEEMLVIDNNADGVLIIATDIECACIDAGAACRDDSAASWC